MSMICTDEYSTLDMEMAGLLIKDTALLCLADCDCDIRNANKSPGIEFGSAYCIKVKKKKKISKLYTNT